LLTCNLELFHSSHLVEADLPFGRNLTPRAGFRRTAAIAQGQESDGASEHDGCTLRATTNPVDTQRIAPAPPGTKNAVKNLRFAVRLADLTCIAMVGRPGRRMVGSIQ